VSEKVFISLLKRFLVATVAGTIAAITAAVIRFLVMVTAAMLVFVLSFVVGEEVGLRGARTAAYQIDPDLALALEGTIGADMPGVPPESQPVRLGRGPAITVADRTIIVSRKLIAGLEEVAEEEAIPYQYKLPTYGGTDAGAIHLIKAGILSGVVSVPCRFIHSPTSTLRLNDFENTVRLVTKFIGRLPELVR